MNTTNEDKELIAIKQIISALDSLEVEETKRVLDYVFNRLGLKNIRVDSQYEYNPSKSQNSNIPTLEIEDDILLNQKGVIDIRTFAEQKKPKTAIQMAIVVAYYLAELAPKGEQKQSINSDDITKYFKQANFELPNGEPIYTLRNAKNAGYLESTGETGTYKLNPVGYNLVAHKMSNSGIVEKKVKKARVGKKVSKKHLKK